jgi:hypothetical protein
VRLLRPSGVTAESSAIIVASGSAPAFHHWAQHPANRQAFDGPRATAPARLAITKWGARQFHQRAGKDSGSWPQAGRRCDLDHCETKQEVAGEIQTGR